MSATRACGHAGGLQECSAERRIRNMHMRVSDGRPPSAEFPAQDVGDAAGRLGGQHLRGARADGAGMGTPREQSRTSCQLAGRHARVSTRLSASGVVSPPVCQ